MFQEVDDTMLVSIHPRPHIVSNHMDEHEQSSANNNYDHGSSRRARPQGLYDAPRWLNSVKSLHLEETKT